jgi:peptidoglycan/LPS O-acetylase OafA/YrhL
MCLAWIVAILFFDTYRHAWGLGYADQSVFQFQPGVWILLSPVSMFYVVGLLASVVGLDQFEKIRSTYLALVAIFLYSAGTNGVFGSTSSGFGLLSLSFLIALVLAQRLLRSPALARLGDYSYGAYLIHVPIIGAICTAIITRYPDTRLSAIWTILMVASVIGGVAFGAFEYALHRQLFKRKETRPPIESAARPS